MKMKKIINSKYFLLQLTFVITISLITSCSPKPKHEDTKEVAEEHNDAKFDNNKMEKDAQFLVNAAEINLEEIKLGQLAQQRGNSMHIKELGKMMVDEHTKSLRDLTALANRKVITVPSSTTDDAQDAYKNLNDESGNDFDKTYANLMISEHKEAIEYFEKAYKETNDSDIKNWIMATLPALRTHLDHSIVCQKKM